MSSVIEIKEAIAQLPQPEQIELARWFEEMVENAWDDQIEKDAAAGRLDHLIAQAESDIASGRVKSLDEVLGDK